MAYTLKTSGIATDCIFCLMVDEDGSTIKEFVSSTVDSNKTVGAAVSVGSGTWKSTTRPYFQTANSATGGITLGTTVSVYYTTTSFYMAAQDLANAPFLAGHIMTLATGGADERFCRSYDDNTIAIRRAGGYRLTTATVPATNAKFSAGLSFGGGANIAYYALESASTFASDTGTNGGYEFNSANLIERIGGSDTAAGKFYLLAAFDRLLTAAEYQSLHDDYIGTLFDSSGGASALPLLMAHYS